MVFLRNALHSFITGDGTRTRSGPRSGKTIARPNEIARQTKTSKIQKNPNRPNPTSARASVETQLFSITEYSEGIRICACLHPRAVGSVGSGRARRARITHRSRAARRGAIAFAACAKRGGGRPRREDAVNFASREDKLRARFIKDETFVVDASECV